MQYLLGFDCGATKIEYSLADVNGRNLFNSKKITPANLLVNGPESISDDICEIIKNLISSDIINNDPPEFATIVIGIAGGGRVSDADNLKTVLTKDLDDNRIVFKKILVVSDARIALEVSFPRGTGSILVAGTGSIIYGKNNKGKLFRAGGFGRLIGDEGSGYSIGRKALNRAAKDFEKGISNSMAIKLLNDYYSINSVDELLTEVYKNNFDIASVAKHVITLAENKVQFAINILTEESDELIQLIQILMNKMKVDKLDISFSGSLIDKKNVYSDLLRNKIRRLLDTVTVVDTRNNPVDGAILLAKGLVDV